MANDVNRINKRKRKATTDLIFEVDDSDCSSTSSVQIITGSSSSAGIGNGGSQTSEDVADASQILVSEIDLNGIELPPEPKPDSDMELSTTPTPGETKPFIRILFRDEEAAGKLRSKLIQFIQSLIHTDLNEIWHSETDLNLYESDTVEYVIDDADLFILDTMPSVRGRVPKYNFNSVVIGEHTASDDTNSVKKISAAVCFNCGGSHLLRDCQEEKNYRRINEARTQRMTNFKLARYHEDEETNTETYGHFIPGRMSSKLKRALNLRRHEIPPYVYQMRKFGYPPGWLEEAMVTKSDLKVIDFNGSVIDDGLGSNQFVDPNKIFEYPGFNAPLEKGAKDEYKDYDSPPYSETQSKNFMLKYIQKQQFTDDDILTNSETFNSPQESSPVDDGSQLNCNESSNHSLKDSNNTVPELRSDSPSLNDLEMKKKQLLAELEEGSQSSPCETPTSQENEPFASPVALFTSLGTPILKSISPFSTLPSRDNFSKDISQVINFENLPNSTGKYEQINKVLRKVRDVVRCITRKDSQKS